MDMVVHSRQHHFFVMTQEEEMWVYKHLSPVEFELYQQGQARFYEQVLALWQIPQEKCSPKELGNLILSVVLIYNSAARSLPFFFPEGAGTDGQGPGNRPIPLSGLSGRCGQMTTKGLLQK